MKARVRNSVRLSCIGLLTAGLALTAFACSSDDPTPSGSAGTPGNAGSAGAGGGAAGNGGTSGAAGSASAGTAGAGGAGGSADGSSMAGSGGTVGAGTGGSAGSGGNGGSGGAGGAAPFKLTSTAFTEGAEIPAEYTCVSTNGSIMSRPSRPLAWGPGPAGTMGYAIVLKDTDNGFTHWAIWDIPADKLGLPRDVSQAERRTLSGIVVEARRA
ncbi:MAG TPA: hypothetical protein VJN18_19890 [Polyangiaceae bacterium]|nr:hypothetical protein [Polyangiaceae bacterium]